MATNWPSCLWYIQEPRWHDHDEVRSIAVQIASKGLNGEWQKFLDIANVYGYLGDRPSPAELLRRAGK